MIARIWHGVVHKPLADEYLHLMRTVALPDYRRIPGNIAAYVLQRGEQDVVHFTTLTFWESADAIAAFAGADISLAKYYDFDKDFLLELEPRVEHYEVYVD